MTARNQYSSDAHKKFKVNNLKKFKTLGYRASRLFDGYLVNECGEVVSIHTGKVKKQQTDPKGYKRVQLLINKEQFSVLVHRMVGIAFLGEPPDDKNTINHKDGNKANNHYSNLEWCSYKENEHHKIHVLKTGSQGENNGTAKITRSIAEEIRKVLLPLKIRTRKRNLAQQELMEKYDLQQPHIWLILNNKLWK